MRSLLGLVLVIGMAWAQEPKPADEEAKDRAALQGTWELEQLEINGKKTLAGDLKKAAALLIIKDNTIAFWSDLGKKGTFTLDTSKTPRWITVEDTKKNKEQGLYEVKGDELKICMAKTGTERPKEFASKANSDVTLLAFKRVPKKEPEKDKDKKDKKDKKD